ncbi:putative receptor-like protein kinase [Citrus sinensis]|uniref:Protein kinase domain-containing protein n=1 Tax=Citrus clementina TaxID=85681 RepID=V4SQN8_CITCL|nr:hypothetical protein CICLE_v10027050mg [Citrus x clementina]KAH9669545.1 putative receptor-like protein kinase [Citrus sinensis]
MIHLEVTSSLTNSVNLCEWTGVTCGHRHQRVTKSDLGNQSIGDLSFINIADNGVQGEIPNELGNLVRLEKLILANNSFSGTIPTNLSLRSKLMLFFANRNILAGEIPAEIGNLFKLEKLSFCVIKLTGQLPASIQNLSSHLEADSNRNNFGGKIPESPGQLRSLFYLNVGGNQFSGMFLPVYNLSSLEMIYLHDNRLNGNLPPVIGAKLPNLRKIVIALNNFTGPLPDSFSNASNRERLELSYNQFRGKDGEANNLYFITLLTNCSRLEWLGFYDSQFGGVLLHPIANVSTMMTKIIMGGNKIFGLSSSRSGLECHIVYGNSFKGIVLVSLSSLKSIEELDLSSNNLSGQLPRLLVNLSFLVLLNLYNHFDGEVPTKGVFNNKTRISLAGNGKLCGGFDGLHSPSCHSKDQENFVAECEALRNIHHKNLLKIITVCSKKWLYLSDDFLEMCKFSLFQRLNITIDVASAIEYLHHRCRQPMVHARFLSDIPLCTVPEIQSSSIGIKGTVDCSMVWEASLPGDLCSFGVMLLEMFIRRRPTDNAFSEGLTLHEYAKITMQEKVMEIIDSSLKS